MEDRAGLRRTEILIPSFLSQVRTIFTFWKKIHMAKMTLALHSQGEEPNALKSNQAGNESKCHLLPEACPDVPSQPLALWCTAFLGLPHVDATYVQTLSPAPLRSRLYREHFCVPNAHLSPSSPSTLPLTPCPPGTLASLYPSSFHDSFSCRTLHRLFPYLEHCSLL